MRLELLSGKRTVSSHNAGALPGSDQASAVIGQALTLDPGMASY